LQIIYLLFEIEKIDMRARILYKRW